MKYSIDLKIPYSQQSRARPDWANEFPDRTGPAASDLYFQTFYLSSTGYQF